MTGLPEDPYEPYWKLLGIVICIGTAAVTLFGIAKLLGVI